MTQSDRRRHSRSRASLVATLNFGPWLLPCFIADISEGGARIQLLESATLPGGPAVLESTSIGRVAASLVWQKGLYAGLCFPNPPAVHDAAKRSNSVAGSAPRITDSLGFRVQFERATHPFEAAAQPNSAA